MRRSRSPSNEVVRIWPAGGCTVTCAAISSGRNFPDRLSQNSQIPLASAEPRERATVKRNRVEYSCRLATICRALHTSSTPSALVVQWGGLRPKGPGEPRRGPRGLKAVTDIQGITLREPRCHYPSSPYTDLTTGTHSPILIGKNSVLTRIP
jgi:hypothetical protein